MNDKKIRKFADFLSEEQVERYAFLDEQRTETVVRENQTERKKGRYLMALPFVFTVILLLCLQLPKVISHFQPNDKSFPFPNNGPTVIVDELEEKHYETILASRHTFAKNYEELANVSDVVVLAKVEKKVENHLIYTPGENPVVGYGYTISQIRIEKVFSGEGIEENATILLSEDYFTVTNERTKEKITFAQEGYLPANEGESYIFFLKKWYGSEKDTEQYCPTDLSFGKYPLNLDADTASFEEFQLRHENEGLDAQLLEKYREWYANVKRDYMY